MFSHSLVLRPIFPISTTSPLEFAAAFPESSTSDPYFHSSAHVVVSEQDDATHMLLFKETALWSNSVAHANSTGRPTSGCLITTRERNHKSQHTHTHTHLPHQKMRAHENMCTHACTHTWMHTHTLETESYHSQMHSDKHTHTHTFHSDALVRAHARARAREFMHMR